MLRVFADAGLQAHRALADGVYDLTFPLPAGEADVALGSYRDAVAERERSADVASLRHVLAPASVAVIGVGRRPGSVGRAILRNIVTGGFSGPVYAVNPAVTELDGVPCVPSVAALARGRRPGGHRHTGGGRGRYRRRMRATGGQGAGGASGGTQRRGPHGAAGHLPPPRHANGRTGQLRAWPTPAPAWTRRSRPAIPGRDALAWRCSRPVAPASPWSSTCPGSVSGSPPSSRSATKTTWPAPTCCCGGSPTRRPSWPCCILSRSRTRPSSPARPAASAAAYRS